MKKFLSKIRSRLAQIDKRLLLIIGVIFIVSPGWLLSLYWMKYHTLPWGKDKSELQEESQNQKIEEERKVDDREPTREDLIADIVENDIFREFPYDLTKEDIEADIIKGSEVKDYEFYDSYIIVKDRKYEFTNHTRMYAYGDSTKLDINDGLKRLEKYDPIYSVIFSKKGRYVISITFDK